MSLSKVIEIAVGELGQHEAPAGSNRVKYWEWWPAMQGQPWCVGFLGWTFDKAGESKAFFNGGKTASCTRLMELYKAEGRWFTDGNYQPGDLPIMTFSKTREVQHCGLIIDKSDDGGWYTVEGNTSPGMEGSQDRGGCVAKKIRYKANILGVCRPQYSEEPEIVVPDYKGRWSEEYWEKGISLGIIKEAKDGKYRPTDNATREEVLAMIIRSREESK